MIIKKAATTAKMTSGKPEVISLLLGNQSVYTSMSNVFRHKDAWRASDKSESGTCFEALCSGCDWLSQGYCSTERCLFCQAMFFDRVELKSETRTVEINTRQILTILHSSTDIVVTSQQMEAKKFNIS